MGRKNVRATKGRGKPQARRDIFGNTAKPRPQPVPTEKMVLPKGVCSSGKLRFATEADAKEALRQAQARRAHHRSGRIEQRYYGGPDDPCQRGCGGFHLTSRAEWRKS